MTLAMTDPLRPPGLIWRYCEELQVCHYARRTIKTLEQWLRWFLRFHGLGHPRGMGRAELNALLSHLALDLHVGPSTQNQAHLAGLLYGRRLRLMEALRLRVPIWSSAGVTPEGSCR